MVSLSANIEFSGRASMSTATYGAFAEMPWPFAYAEMKGYKLSSLFPGRFLNHLMIEINTIEPISVMVKIDINHEPPIDSQYFHWIPNSLCISPWGL
jgi:hypothetical protein